ncbi:MAG TPA: O-antigen ligase family protein [Kiritimatiellia bacterium]|nr:O-antigen ligase family protein [Kiritimatiellia bacterium]HMO98700.1 O-antigen ligase family protein [Kiritimatiellia bacterium]
MSLWAFRFLLFYICILCVQPQNRFVFLHPLRIANAAIILSLLFHLLAVSQEGKRFIRMGPATITALILLLASIISLYTGPWQADSSWNANSDLIFKSCIVIIMVEAMAYNVQRVWAVLTALMLATLWWIKGGLRLVAAGATYQGDRIMGPAVSLIENPNGFAYMMTVMIPLYLYFFQKAQNRWLRWGFLFLALSGTYITLETGSRTGVVALFAVALFLLPKYGAKRKGTLALIGVVVFTLFSYLSPGNIERFKTIPESARKFFSGVEEDAYQSVMTMDEQSAWERKMKNKHTWALIMDFPLFGVGVNADIGAYLDWDKMPYAYGDVHNELLFAGRQMGFIGMGLYLTLLGIILRMGWRAQRVAKGWWSAAEDLGWTLKMQGIVFLVGGFFSPLPWNPIFMILAGCASALAYNLKTGAYSASQPGENG